MAFNDCLTSHGIKTHARLPSHIKQKVAELDAMETRNDYEREQRALKQRELVLAMTEHIKSLKATKTVIENQVKDFKKTVIDNSIAGTYVNRANDPTNELNTFETKGVTSLLNNLVQRFNGLTAAVGSKLFGKREDFTEGDRALITHFSQKDGFAHDMSRAMQQIFKAKEGTSLKFRTDDLIQFLLTREPNMKAVDKLDAPTRAAIASAAYDWLAINGRKAMGQTEGSLRSLLSLEDDDRIPDIAYTLLSDTGMSAETMAKQIGQVAFDRMGIKPGPKSDVLAKARMELSLGLMAIAAMEHAGILERQYVKADRTADVKALLTIPYKQLTADQKKLISEKQHAEWIEEGQIGLEGIKSGRNLKEAQVFGTSETMKGFIPLIMMKLKHETKSVRLPDGRSETYPVVSDHLKEIEEFHKKGRTALDKLFGTSSPERGTLFKRPKAKKYTVARTGVEVNAQQAANVDKYSQIAHVKNEGLINFFEAMDRVVEGQTTEEAQIGVRRLFQEVMGAPESDHLLNRHHKSDEGIRRGIDEDFRAIQEFEAEWADEIAKGGTGEFYMANEFMTNMRMLMLGPINTQNKKMHRIAFAPKDFIVTFKKGKNKGLDEAFHEALALAFDIESGKEGGYKAQLAKLEAKRQEPEVKAAVAAIKEHLGDGKMTVKRMVAIRAGVAKVDNKVTGLKGLYELARYELAPEGKDFTTDLHAEIDGVTNGIIIGLLQLMPNSAEKRDTLAMLAMGGVLTVKGKANLDELLIQNNLYDTYKRMAQEWALELDNLKKGLSNSTDEKDQDLMVKVRSLEKLLGSFHDNNGIVKKSVRKMSKPRTTQIMYGAGLGGQVTVMINETVIGEGIYKKVEDIIKMLQSKDAAQIEKAHVDFEAHLDAINTIIGPTFVTKANKVIVNKPITSARYMEKGRLSVEMLKHFQLTDWQERQITIVAKATYGKAMKKAVENMFKPFIETRAHFNSSVQLAVTTYNTILRKKVELWLEKNKTTVITKEALAEITKSIEHLIPKIATPYHKEGSESYMALADVAQNRVYNKKDKVTQNYESGTVSVLYGTAEGIPYLKDSGVAPIIKTIHMLDSMVANGLMGQDITILNAHDGFGHAITSSKALALNVNTLFGKIMTEYSLGQAYKDMSESHTKAARKVLDELGITSEELLWGSASKEDGVLTGGLFNDRVVSIDLLEQLGWTSREEMKAAVGEMQEEGEENYQKAQQIFLRNVIEENLSDSPIDFFVTKGIIGQLVKNVTEMAEQTTANKQAITDSVQHWVQYPFRGR
jgi:hypothetical protein